MKKFAITALISFCGFPAFAIDAGCYKGGGYDDYGQYHQAYLWVNDQSSQRMGCWTQSSGCQKYFIQKSSVRIRDLGSDFREINSLSFTFLNEFPGDLSWQRISFKKISSKICYTGQEFP